MKRIAVFLIVFLAMAGIAIGETIEWKGKCVAVSDGDTISVMRDGKAEKIRLYGIDCPEKRQAFGTQAKKFTSDMVFGKTVRVQATDTDRYGRRIGIVYVGKEMLNAKLIAAGMAWHYKRYSDNKALADLEKQARAKKIGLWSDSNPTPPWEYRLSGYKRGGTDKRSARKERSVRKATAPAAHGMIYHGNYKTRKFHKPGCRYYNCSKCTKTFNSREAATSAGYVPCKICGP